MGECIVHKYKNNSFKWTKFFISRFLFNK